MPYEWTTAPDSAAQQMRLWPHQSLPARGFAAFILTTFTMILIPTLTLLGTVLLWGMLPFVMMAVIGVYIALQSNHKSRQIEEVLTIDSQNARLTHTTPKGEVKEWQCNRYWTKVTKYENEGREVEIGSFLSEEERIELYEDLQRSLNRDI